MENSVLKGCAATALALALTACGGASAGGDGSAKSPSSAGSQATPSAPVAAPSSTPESESSFKDDVLTTPTMKIEITKQQVIPVGKKGNEYGSKPVLALWYTTTNLSGEKVSPMDFISMFRAFQDNNPNAENELQIGGLPDDKFLDSQTENIKKGGTVENAVAYELDDQTTPVILVASNDLGMTEIGKATYELK